MTAGIASSPTAPVSSAPTASTCAWAPAAPRPPTPRSGCRRRRSSTAPAARCCVTARPWPGPRRRCASPARWRAPRATGAAGSWCAGGVIDEGVGLLRWAIGADDLASARKSYATRARGPPRPGVAAAGRRAGRMRCASRRPTGCCVRTPPTWAASWSRSTSARRTSSGRGPWRKLRSAAAWKGTLLRGRRGARLRVRLPAGRTALLVRGRKAAAVRIGAKTVRVRPGRRTVLGPKRRRAGTVTVSVTRGNIDLDGIAASP